MTALVEVVTTVAREEDAASLARSLVEAGACACATFFPVRSIYRWKGEVQDEAEFQVVAKTTAERAPEAERHIAKLHPYETPAVIVVPLLRAAEGYAAWVAESVRKEQP